MDNKPVLSLKDYVLKNNEKVIAENINLELVKGKCTGLYGPTGAGKSTLLKQIFLLLKDDYKVSFVFQDNCLINNQTVKKNVILPLENKISKNEAEIICGEHLLAFDLLQVSEKKAGQISGGEAQRCGIARAFAWNGDVFLLDEPFSAQDDNHKKVIMEHINRLKEKERAVLLVSHNKDDLQQLCHTFIELK